MITLKKLNEAIEKNNRKIVFLFFFLFFYVGLSVYKDYGMSWDEYAQWFDNGQANFNFIFHNDTATLLNGIDKYHGPAFELLLIGIEKTFNITDWRDIFLMRHLAIFIAFFISSIFFYLVAKKIFLNWRIAFVGVLMYMLSPHIFAHAFYNSKDAVFLSFFTINTYALLCFHEKPNYKRAFIYAIISAITIDIRIIGILLPAISGFLFLIASIKAVKSKTKFRSNTLSFLFYFIALIPFVILFWPVLWLDPIYHFIEALKENSSYPWDGEVLYFGIQQNASELPRHYVPFWIFISKPIIYSVLFLVGTITLLWAGIKNPFLFLANKKYETIALIWFLFPLIAIVVFKSRSFDTGRHLYFMNGGFILIALFGWQALRKIFEKRIVVLYALNLMLFVSFAGVVYKMIKIHPYQNLYFNSCLGTDMEKIKNNFEFDYWGVGNKEVLEKILANDSAKIIKVFAENMPGKLNQRILTKEQRARLDYVDTIEIADYFIADYRWHREEEYAFRRAVYSATIGNAAITTAFRVREPEELFDQTKGTVLKSFATGFDNLQPVWDNNNIVQPHCGAHSALYVAMVDSVIEFSSSLTVTNLDYIYNKKGVVLKASFWKYVDQLPANAKLVVTITKPDGKPFFWGLLKEIKQDSIRDDKWEKVSGAVDLPVIKDEKYVLKIYLWNPAKTRVFMDDVKVDFVEEN